METYKEAWNDSGRRARFKTVTSYMTPENVILLSGGLKYFKSQIIFCFSDGIGSEYSIDEIYSVDAGTPYILEFCTGDSEILYNELVINTASQDEKRNSIKMQLSYIVYIQENSQEDKANNTLWEESQKAAQQFGIPIVVRDREKIQLHERQQIIDGCRCEGAKDQQRYARFIKCLYSLLNGLVK